MIGSNLITFHLINVPGFVGNLLKILGHSCVFLASESVGVLSKKVNVRVHCYLQVLAGFAHLTNVLGTQHTDGMLIYWMVKYDPLYGRCWISFEESPKSLVPLWP